MHFDNDWHFSLCSFASAYVPSFFCTRLTLVRRRSSLPFAIAAGPLISIERMTESEDAQHVRVGWIYSIRQSVQNAFGISTTTATSLISTSNGSVSTASSPTKAPTSRARSRAHTRPCVLWTQEGKKSTVLLLTTFNGRDPLHIDAAGCSIIPNITPEQLRKRILAIEPTKPIPGRPSISFSTLPGVDDKVKVQENHFLLLSPVVIDEEVNWASPSNARFSCNDLLIINNMIGSLQFEQLAEEELSVVNEKADFYRAAVASPRSSEELIRQEEKFESRTFEIKQRRDFIRQQMETQQQLIQLACRSAEDGESQSIPAVRRNGVSPLLGKNFSPYTSSGSSLDDDDDNNNESIVSKSLVQRWLNNQVFGKTTNFIPTLID